MHEYKPGKITCTALFLFFVFIDQFSKYIIRSWGGFYICNKNFAFGLTLGQTSMVIALVIVLAMLNFKFQIFPLKRDPAKAVANLSNGTIIGITLITSGAVSNIIDRFYFGCVIDFIDLKFWPVFNLADIYITIGSILIITLILSKKSN